MADIYFWIAALWDNLISAWLPVVQGIDVELSLISDRAEANEFVAAGCIELHTSAEVEQAVECVLFPNAVHALQELSTSEITSDVKRLAALRLNALIGGVAVEVASADACCASEVCLEIYNNVGLVL